MWTGFDYHGEPNPFVNINISSNFGTIDLCGIEKPPFRYYKLWWTDEPMLKSISGYVKLGKAKNTPWEVRLFEGGARVFVKSKNPVRLIARIK